MSATKLTGSVRKTYGVLYLPHSIISCNKLYMDTQFALPGISQRLDIDGEHLLYMTQNFESRFKTLVGTMLSLKKA